MLLVINQSCKKMDNQEFKVFGDAELLNNTKITIVEVGDFDSEKIRTLLFFGRRMKLKPETEVGVVYKIYISYKDSVVNVLKFDNVMRNANDHINHLYLEKEKDIINIIYVGRESEIRSKKGFYKILIPVEDFYKQEGIIKNEDKEKAKKLLFDIY